MRYYAGVTGRDGIGRGEEVHVDEVKVDKSLLRVKAVVAGIAVVTRHQALAN